MTIGVAYKNAMTVKLVCKLMGGSNVTVTLSAARAVFLSRVTEKWVGMFADQIYSHSCNVSWKC